jgi:uncharacterized membrane protein
LLVSLFTGGVSAFIAVILAYDRKGQAGPVPGSHFAFQLKIFWICFALCLAAGALWIGALFSLIFSHPPLPRPILHGSPDAQLVQAALTWLPVDVQTWSYRFEVLPWRAPALASGQARLGLACMGSGVLISWIAPIWGLFRLAAGRPIGRLNDRL